MIVGLLNRMTTGLQEWIQWL